MVHRERERPRHLQRFDGVAAQPKKVGAPRDAGTPRTSFHTLATAHSKAPVGCTSDATAAAPLPLAPSPSCVALASSMSSSSLIALRSSFPVGVSGIWRRRKMLDGQTAAGSHRRAWSRSMAIVASRTNGGAVAALPCTSATPTSRSRWTTAAACATSGTHLREHALDLAQLEAYAVDLHLAVDTAEKADGRRPAGRTNDPLPNVTCEVPPAAAFGPCCRRDVSLGGELWPVKVAASDLRPADGDLALGRVGSIVRVRRHPNRWRQRHEVRIQQLHGASTERLTQKRALLFDILCATAGGDVRRGG